MLRIWTFNVNMFAVSMAQFVGQTRHTTPIRSDPQRARSITDLIQPPQDHVEAWGVRLRLVRNLPAAHHSGEDNGNGASQLGISEAFGLPDGPLPPTASLLSFCDVMIQPIQRHRDFMLGRSKGGRPKDDRQGLSSYLAAVSPEQTQHTLGGCRVLSRSQSTGGCAASSRRPATEYSLARAGDSSDPGR